MKKNEVEEEAPGNPQILLRLPAEIGVPLLRTAKKQKTTVQAIIIEIVGAHYAVDVARPARGRPKKSPNPEGK